jgi:hypothetical protein
MPEDDPVSSSLGRRVISVLSSDGIVIIDITGPYEC